MQRVPKKCKNDLTFRFNIRNLKISFLEGDVVRQSDCYVTVTQKVSISLKNIATLMSILLFQPWFTILSASPRRMCLLFRRFYLCQRGLHKSFPKRWSTCRYEKTHLIALNAGFLFTFSSKTVGRCLLISRL